MKVHKLNLLLYEGISYPVHIMISDRRKSFYSFKACLFKNTYFYKHKYMSKYYSFRG